MENRKTRISEALAIIDPDMLVYVWQEMECRLYGCQVSKGLQIEYL